MQASQPIALLLQQPEHPVLDHDVWPINQNTAINIGKLLFWGPNQVMLFPRCGEVLDTRE
jgi:hypothetical protein